MQKVTVGTSWEDLILPDQLEAADIEGNAFSIPVTWESHPVFDGQTAGEYIFSPILTEGYTVAEGAELPSIKVIVQDASSVDTPKPAASFAQLEEGVALQSVPLGTTLESLTLPDQLEAADAEGNAFSIPVTWESEPKYDGQTAGEYIFSSVLPEGYTVAESIALPSVKVIVGQEVSMLAENSYLVGSSDDYAKALEEIQKASSSEVTIVLTADLQTGDRKATTEEEKGLVGGTSPENQNVLGVVGKHITFTSAENEQHNLGINWTYLVGDVTFDRIKMTKDNDVFANGFLMEFTKSFEGGCSGYVYGGSNRRAVDSTHLIFNAGSFGNGSTSYGIYGGGYAGGMGRPTGPSLGLDGEPGMPGWTPPEFKAGIGDVNGDVRVEIGGTATLTYLIGGSRNGNVKGNVHITLQSDSADTRTVGWIAGSGYGNQAGYGNVMGDVTIDALSGNVAYITGTGNQGATSDSGIKLGDVDSVGGDVNITVGQSSGTPMYIRQSGGGNNLLSGCGKPMTIANGGVTVCGDVNITLNKTAQLDDGDTSTLYYGSVFGVHSNSAVCGSVNIVNNGATLRDLIGAADGAQILGNGRDHALKIVMNDGELRNTNSSNSGRGYIRPYKSAYGGGGETQIKNDVIFEVNGGTLWGAEATEKTKNTFTIDGDFTAVITTTTKNGLVTAVGGKVGTELTDGHKSTAVFTGGGNILIDNVIDFDEVIVKDNTTARLRAVNDEDGGDSPYPFAKDDGVPAVKDVTIEEGSILALYKEGEITGNLTVNGTLALARQSSGVIAPMTAHGTASGNGALRPIGTSTSLFMKSAPKHLEEYVYAQTVDSNMTLSLDSSNNSKYFVDRKASAESGQDVWFINEGQPAEMITVTYQWKGGDSANNIPKDVTLPGPDTIEKGSAYTAKQVTSATHTFDGWYLDEDYTQRFTDGTKLDKDTTLYGNWRVGTDEILWYNNVYVQKADGTYSDEPSKHGQGGWAAPDAKVSISSDDFAGETVEQLVLGTDVLYDAGYAKERLSAERAIDAGKHNPLRIYYKRPYTVTYEYEGTAPEGAPALPNVRYTYSGEEVDVAAVPTMDGYVFSGWSIKSPEGLTIKDGKFTTPQNNVVLVGKWTKEQAQEQVWFYEIYYQSYTPDGTLHDENGVPYKWARQTYGHGGHALPDAEVSISHERFDGKTFAWDAIDGSGKETLGIHYVFDENYGPHRLSALCSAATADDPLKIYYRATPHTVTYQYDGVVPDGAPKVPDVVHTSYSAPVTIAENPTLPGYTFSGWKIQSPSGVEIKDGKLTMPNNDVVLVGTWDEIIVPGNLTVTKYVTGNRGDHSRDFPVKVELDDPTFTGTYGDMTFADGIAQFTLKDNESKTAANLPAGLGYTVTETDPYGHTVSYIGQTGAIPEGGTAQATITNHKSGSSGGGDHDYDDDDNDNDEIHVTVKKVWKLDDGRKRTDSVRVELLRNGKHYDWVTLSEDNDWRYTWRDLKDYYSWTVREDDVPKGFDSKVSHRGNTWTITNDDKPQREIPKTGQNWLLPILLGVSGVLVTGYGVYRKKTRGKPDDK